MKRVKCPFCAEMVKRDALLCKHCKSPLAQDLHEPDGVQAGTPPQHLDPKPKWRAKRNVVVTASAATMAALLLLGGMYFGPLVTKAFAIGAARTAKADALAALVNLDSPAKWQATSQHGLYSLGTCAMSNQVHSLHPSYSQHTYGLLLRSATSGLIKSKTLYLAAEPSSACLRVAKSALAAAGKSAKLSLDSWVFHVSQAQQAKNKRRLIAARREAAALAKWEAENTGYTIQRLYCGDGYSGVATLQVTSREPFDHEVDVLVSFLHADGTVSKTAYGYAVVPAKSTADVTVYYPDEAFSFNTCRATVTQSAGNPND